MRKNSSGDERMVQSSDHTDVSDTITSIVKTIRRTINEEIKEQQENESFSGCTEGKIHQQIIDDCMVFRCQIQDNNIKASLYNRAKNELIVKVTIRNYFMYEDNLANWKIEDVARDDNILGKGSFGRVFKIDSDGNQNYMAVKMIDYIQGRFFSNLYSTLNEVLILKQLKSIQGAVQLRNAYFINTEFANRRQDTFCDDQQNDGFQTQDCESWFQNNILNFDSSGTISLAIGMDFCDCTLQDLINVRAETNIPWNEGELLHIAYQLCEVLHQTQMIGICHRDIKPVNILYHHKNSNYLLSDWGEAKKLMSSSTDGQLNSSKSVRGTPLYMAPELAIKDDRKILYDPFKSDLYSLGIVLVHLMVNKGIKECQSQDVKKLINLISLQGYHNLLPLVREMLNLDPEKRPKPSYFMNKISCQMIIKPNETICINYLQKKQYNDEEQIQFLKQIAFGYIKFFNYKLAVEQFNKIIGICDKHVEDYEQFTTSKTLDDNSGLILLALDVEKKSQSDTKLQLKLTPSQYQYFQDQKNDILYSLGKLHYEWCSYDQAWISFNQCQERIKKKIKNSNSPFKNTNSPIKNINSPSLGNKYQENDSVYLLQQCVTNMSNLSRFFGKYSEARLLLDESLELLEQTRKKNFGYYKQKIYLVKCKALLHKNLGQMQDAETTLNVALSIVYEKMPKQYQQNSHEFLRSFLYLFLSLGQIYESGGDLEPALANFKFCMRNIKQKPNSESFKNICSYYNNIARVQNRLKNFKKGKEYFLKAKDAYDRTCQGNVMMQLQMNKTQCYFKWYSNNIQQALDLLDKNSELLKKIVDENKTVIELQHMIMQAEITFTGQDILGATQLLDACEKIQNKVYEYSKEGFMTLGDIKLLRAQIHLKQNNLKSALTYIGESAFNYRNGKIFSNSYRLEQVKRVKQQIQDKFDLLLFIGNCE